MFKTGNYFECDPTVTFNCVEFIAGDCVKIQKGVEITGNKIHLGDYTRICPNVIIGGGSSKTEDSNVTIGKGVLVCRDVYLNNARNLYIGDDVGIGQHVEIWTHGLWMNTLLGYPRIFKDTIIGNHVWITSHTSILAGSRIGDNVIIANHSLINRDIPSGCFAGGIPVKIIKANVYPPKITSEEQENLLRRLREEWLSMLGWKGTTFDSKYLNCIGNLKIKYKDTIFDCNSMRVIGYLDTLGEDFRDYLRRNGIKFYTGKPFKSIWRKFK